ncbi:MAG: hypothetical protein CL607_12575 [Anaerolineaceae bacterium]|nr:hypothetical protein [Anaerolineaceae bacterium]
MVDLFKRTSIENFIANAENSIKDEIAQYDDDYILGVSIDELVIYFEEKYTLRVPILQTDNISIDQPASNAQQDMRNARVTFHIPFEGDSNLFNAYPPRISWPINETIFVSLHPYELVISQYLGLIRANPGGAERDRDAVINYIESTLQRLRTAVAEFNENLAANARKLAEQRKQEVLSHVDFIHNLGFPIRERKNAPKTYTVPTKKRRIPSKPPAKSTRDRPEPALALDDYNYILSIIESMVTVMERSPKAFQDMDEESLRQHFLVQLNGHYEGQATGETFNYEGKTDILIRTDGTNIFIAECKFWKGPKQLSDTIDQLLKYVSWRDTKTAILLFNRNKNFSKVLEQIEPTVTSHPNYKRTISRDSETQFRYKFFNRDDPDRELYLTVMAFEVPG